MCKFFSVPQYNIVHLRYVKRNQMSMNRTLYLALMLVAGFMASCSEQYSVQGSSSISSLDGSKLYLKAIKNKELTNIDSCEVVHGQFHFSGTLDTVRMASLFMDDKSLMPIVLEQGDIRIKLDQVAQSVSGTPMNELLYKFMKLHNQLDNEMEELSHKQSQMMLDGIDEEVINRQLSMEAAVIAQREDSLVTHFIIENFDNVLGPGVFMMITAGYPYPVLTPQIEDIMSKATDKFKNDPYVKDYYQTALDIQARQSGLDTPADQAIQQQQGMQSSQLPTDSIR